MAPRSREPRTSGYSRFLATIRPAGDVAGQYAGFASRGLALVIDLILTTLIVIGTLWVINATLALLRIDVDTCTRFVPMRDMRSLLENACRLIRAGEYIFSLALGPFYFFILWWLTGETVGMRIAGVQVISAKGGRLTALAALLRLVGYAISVLALGLGFIWALIDDRRQGWHDKLASTYVIYRRPHHNGEAKTR